MRKSLGLLERFDWLEGISLGPVGPLDWDNYYVAANYARLESSVTLDASQTSQTVTADRPLQGASPYVANVQIGYSAPGGKSDWTLLYNVFGERIARAGVAGQPDVYEQPFPQLDFVYRRRLGEDWSFSLKLRNLLDPRVEFTQGDEVTRVYRKGREVNIGFKWTF